MTHLTNDELQLFAELLDEVPGREAALLRDRIETHLYLAGHYVTLDVGYDETINMWIARDGLHTGYGFTEGEAITNLHIDMGRGRK